MTHEEAVLHDGAAAADDDARDAFRELPTGHPHLSSPVNQHEHKKSTHIHTIPTQRAEVQTTLNTATKKRQVATCYNLTIIDPGCIIRLIRHKKTNQKAFPEKTSALFICYIMESKNEAET
jgi:hypothetical protein